MSTDNPSSGRGPDNRNRTPTEKKALRRVERTAGGRNVKDVVPVPGTSLPPEDDAQTMAHTSSGAVSTSTNLSPLHTGTNSQAGLLRRDKTSAGSEAGNQTMVVLPSMETAHRDRTSVGRRYISVEAVVKMPDGKRYSFRTRKVSSRGLFLSASTSMLPLSRGLDVEIELRGEKRTVSFQARVAHVVKEDVHGLGESGFGFQIISISREQQAELEKLIAETPSRTDLEAAERKQRTKQYLGVVLALLVLGGLGMVVYAFRPIPKVHVERATASVSTFEEVLQSTPGEIVPHRFVSVRSTLSSPLMIELVVKRGEAVKTGQALAQSFQVRAQAKQIQTKIAAAEAALETLKSGGGTPAAIQTATSKVSSLKDELAKKEAEATKQQIVAPFAGVVSELTIQTGDVLAPGGTVCELVDTEVLRASVPFSEADAAKIKRGMKAHIVTPAHDIDGTIEELGAVVRAYGKGKAVLVEAVLSKAEDVRPGSTARVDVILNDRKALSIPEDAAVGSGTFRKVFVVTAQNRLEAKHVEIGGSSRGNFEVLSGLEEGAVVVRHPAPDLVSGGEVYPPASP